MRRLLVTGGSGYLGSQLIEAAHGWDVWATFFSRPGAPGGSTARRLDLRDAAAVRALVREAKPQAIIHAACSNRDPDNQSAIVPAARQVALAAREFGARLIHLSTDLVFDGEHAPYADDWPPAPIVPYGRAKAEAEAVVAQVCPAAVIARPSLIWGLAPIDRQTRWLVDGLQRGERVTLFTDEFRSPVYVRDLCAALLELAARPDLSGPLNLGGAQALSRWGFGLKLLAALGLAPGSNVVPGRLRESGLVRARDTSLTSDRARHWLRARLRSVDEVLASTAVEVRPRRPRRPQYCEG